MRLKIPTALPLILAACHLHAAETTEVSFQKDLIPLLKRRCASCHITGQEPGNMALTPKRAYSSLVDVSSIESPLKRVAPGAPKESYLLHKLQGTQRDVGGSGEKMPFMAPPLSKSQIVLIRAWIVSGAPNN